ncbi:MAG TPA: hypothetical protein GXZ56_00235 [Bacteroidales bacterium]|jgi:hypothetical protein|nr:hypothetical protein [Bacteroidales bacterium]
MLKGMRLSGITNGIQPWKANRRFYQYKGRPVMVLGANNDNNLFLKKI